MASVNETIGSLLAAYDRYRRCHERGENDKEFVYRWQRAVQCNIVDYNDDRFPLAHSIPTHKSGKSGQPRKTEKPSQSDSLQRKRHKAKQRRQRQVISISERDSDGDNEPARPKHKARQKRQRRVVRGNEEGSHEYKDDEDEDEGDATPSITTTMPLVLAVKRGVQLSRQNKPYVATIVIPPSQTALEYKPPPGVRKITVGELRDLFDGSKSDPVHYAAIHRDNKCEYSFDNLTVSILQYCHTILL